jgi:hypothetical protein
LSKVTLSKVSVSLPFHLGSAEWKPDEVERRAAWQLYVELVTRVATQEMVVGDGLDEEVMESLYDLFIATRRILRSAGPKAGVAHDSVGGIAVAVLNRGLRPFLSKWHAKLTSWSRESRTSSTWPDHAEFREALSHLTTELDRYAEILAVIAGVGKDL